jgi:hypothetical protein
MSLFMFGISVGQSMSGNTDAGLVFLVLALLCLALDRRYA